MQLKFYKKTILCFLALVSTISSSEFHSVFYGGSWRYVPTTNDTWRWAGGICGGGYKSCSGTHQSRDPHWCYTIHGLRPYMVSCQQTACPVNTELKEMSGTCGQVFMFNGYYNYEPVSDYQSGGVFSYSGNTYTHMDQGYVPAFSPGCLYENYGSICIPGACKIDPGYYSTYDGNHDFTYQQSSSEKFVSNPVEVLPCPIGYMCNNGLKQNCPTGQVQPEPAQHECINCSNGTTPSYQNDMCSPCPPEEFSNEFTHFQCQSCNYPLAPINGQSECGYCQYGYGINNQNYCAECQENEFTNEASQADNRNECHPCPEYAKSGKGASICITCNPGEYMDSSSNNRHCEPCPAGKYSSSVAITSSEQCIQCPANTFSDTIGADSATTCKPCEIGKWSSPGSTSCNLCSSAETSKNQPNCNPCTRLADDTSRQTCSSCVGFKYYDLASDSCVSCPNGMHTSIIDPLTCVSFKEANCLLSSDGKTCESCEYGFVVDFERNECKACNKGYYYDDGRCVRISGEFFTPSCDNTNCSISNMWVPTPDGTWSNYNNGNFSLINFIEAYFQYPLDLCKSQSYPSYTYCDEVIESYFTGSQNYRIEGLRFANDSVMYSFVRPLPILPGFEVVKENDLNIGYRPLRAGTYKNIATGTILKCERNYWCPGGTPPLKCPDGTFSEAGSTKIHDCKTKTLIDNTK